MMSTLDQPILIANSNYHVGHQIAIFVAKEQSFSPTKDSKNLNTTRAA